MREERREGRKEKEPKEGMRAKKGIKYDHYNNNIY